jgi:hypothetical protein
LATHLRQQQRIAAKITTIKSLPTACMAVCLSTSKRYGTVAKEWRTPQDSNLKPSDP